MIRMEQQQSMPQLMEMPRVEKFNYPGLADRSMPPALVDPIVEEDAVEKKPKAKKEKKEYIPTGGRKLKLSKPKNM